ncbi:hypothetical protein IMCC26134_09730 [Verrucomicrobia bacterium IMCC26134]|nr:hypothetical protein IMCC26134_09730 [Verrucomicrobia bacterium IMCC26134]
MITSLRSFFAVFALGVLLAPAADAAAVDFPSAGGITINNLLYTGPGNPYPSPVTVTNMGVVSAVRVKINGFNSDQAADVDVFLVAPNGRVSAVFSDVGGDVFTINNINLVLDDAATANLPANSTLASGTYKPINNQPVEAVPAGATGPIGTNLSALAANGANGVWKLYVTGDGEADNGGGGSIASWALVFDTTGATVTTPTASTITTTAATLGGNVTAAGGLTITSRGVVLAPTSTNSDPAIGGTGVVNLTTSGTTGIFTLNASSLSPQTAYTYKAYATTSAGTSYSVASSFNTQITLTYAAGAGGSLTGTTPQTVNYNASGSAVTAVPAANYHFVNWSDASTSNPRTDANVTAAKSVTANFAINTFTLTYTAGANGSLTGTTPQTVNYNASGSAVTAVPAANYHFVNWSDASTSNPRTDANVTAAKSVTANFAINTFTLTYTAGANGSLTGTTPQTVNYNASGSAVTAVPAANYHFVNWSDSSTANPRTDTGVTADRSVTANFVFNLPPVVPLPIVTLNGPATVTMAANSTYTESGAFSGPSALAAGGSHNLALRSDGTVAAWGYNYYGQTTLPYGLINVVALAAGKFHSLALRSDGTVAAWGYNYYGQTTLPVGLSNVVAIAAGWEHSLALRSDGTVAAWGGNAEGQSTIPAGLSNVVAISAGHYHSLALRSDGTVVEWGHNYYAYTTLPAGLSNVVAISAGYYHSLALRSDGTVVAWGYGGSGLATIPAGLSNVVAIAAGGGHSLALRSDGTVAAWGDNYYGQTTLPAGLSNVVALAGGEDRSLALRSDGTVVAWGDNYYGQTTIPANAYLPATVSGNVDTHTPGSYVLTYSATNFLGGSSSNTRTVVVVPPFTLTYAAGANGSLTGTTPQTVDYGTAGTSVTAVPAPGYHLVDWSDGSTANPRTDVVVTANRSVTANFAIGGYTLAYAAGANGSLTGTTPQTVIHGTSGTAVTAVPAPGYHFVNWSDGSTASPRTDTNVMADRSVTANFAIGGYILTYTAGANGSLTGTTPQTVNYNASGSAVTAVPAANYHFVSWSDDSTANPRTDTNAMWNVNVTATFAINTYTLTYAAGTHGSLTGSTPQTVEHGTTGTAVTAVPVPGYHFVVWSDGATANPRTDTNVMADRSVTANFAIGGYILTYTAGAHGSLTGSTPQTVDFGTAGTAVTAVPAPGYHFVVWSDGATASPRTDTNVMANVNVTANFAGIPPGTLDPLNLGVEGTGVYGTAVQPDGKTIISGIFTSVLGVPRNSIARLNADGTLDMGFDPNAGGGGVNTIVLSLALQADGKVLIGGIFTTLQPNGAATATTRNRIARLNADGTLDEGFDPNANGTVSSLALQADGKVLIGGSFTTLQPNGAAAPTPRNLIARLHADGMLDMGFDPNANNTVSSLALQADGKVLLGGSFTTLQPNGAASATTRNRIARLNADGTLDLGFDPNVIRINLSGVATGGSVASIVVQADGKVLIGGNFTTLQPNGAATATTRNSIARLNADGTLDMGFRLNPSGIVQSVALQADGKVLLGGQFNLFYPITNNYAIATPRNRIARLNADGTLDASFNPDADGAVLGVALQADGKVLLGGFFTAISSIPRNLFARLDNDAATQTLSAPGATEALWSRGGAAPELTRVTFELSTDGGTTWGAPIAGTRLGATANWQASGLALPASGQLRARGVTSGGYRSVSSGLIEQVTSFTLYTVTYAAGAHGTLSGTTPQWVASGASGTAVIAVPDAGYHFVNWSDGSTANPRTDANVTANLSVNANFALGGYTLGYTAGANGSLTGTMPQTVSHGTSGTAVTAVPANGYHFVNWSDGSTSNPRTDANVTTNLIFTANFALGGYTLAYTAGANGSLTGTAPWTVSHGASGTAVTAVPVTGYHFISWSDGSTANPRTDTSVMTSVNVTASFGLYAPAAPVPTVTLNGSATVTLAVNSTYTESGAFSGPTAIAAGASHSLALRSDGTIAAWGDNTYGQTTPPAGLSNVVAIAARLYHNLALRGDGTVVAWGDQTTIPAGLSNVVAIAAGGSHSLALSSDGTIAAWGDNTYGQTIIPAGLSNVVALAAGTYHNLALRSDGTVIGWGYNAYGQTTIPAGLNNVVAIAAGDFYSLALRGDGTVVGWGDNRSGQLNSLPADLSNVVALAAGYNHSLALRNDGTVTGWGPNYYGQLTNPDGLDNVVAIACGSFYHSLALRSDGTVFAWGYNDHGQTTIPSNVYLPATLSGSVDTTRPGNYVLTYSATHPLGGTSSTTRTVVVPATLTYAAGAHGTLTGTTPQTVNYGASGTALTAVPDANYHFVDWSDGSTANPRNDTNVTADLSVTANFALGGYTLTYAAGAHGTITGSTPQTVDHGANGTEVTAVPAANSQFVSWSDGVLTAARTETNVTADRSVTANFSLNTVNTWRETYFGPTATNSVNAANTADPYHTGVQNLLVYAFFGPAQNPATVQISQLPQATASGNFLSYEFTEPSGVSGLTYGAEWSATLGNDWQPVTDTGIAPVHTFRVPLDGPKKFLRLRVTTQ